MATQATRRSGVGESESDASVSRDASVPRPGIGEQVRAGIEERAARLLGPPRTALLIAVGGTVLLARGLRPALGRTMAARERQLDLFNGSLRRAASRFWSRGWRSVRSH